jgi:HK97 family phage major capsid protein
MDLSHIEQLLAAELAAAEALEQKAKDEGRELTTEEVAKLKAHNDEAESLSERKAHVLESQAETQRLANLRAQALEPDATPAPLPKRAVVDKVQEGVLGDPTGGFKCMGEFAQSVMGYQDGFRDKRLLIGAAVTGMSQAVAADGGFAVPPTYAQQIWDGLNQGIDSPFSQTDNYPVEGSSLTFAANAETSRADGSRYGGVRGYWVNEGVQITSSKPTLRQVTIEPQELAVLVYMTDKLLANNTMALDRFVTKAASEEIDFKVNDALFNGTGVGMPLGLLNSAGIVSVAKEGGQPATTLVAENIDKMYARMLRRARAGAAWYINQDCETELAGLYRATGADGALVYSPPGGISASPYATLYGLPVVPVEYCQTLGTSGDVWLASFGYYLSGNRGGVSSDASIHLRFDYLETAFRFVFSVDGQPWLNSPITPFKGTNTQSAFIKLDVRE